MSEFIHLDADDDPGYVWRTALAPLGIKMIRRLLQSEVYLVLCNRQATTQPERFATWEPRLTRNRLAAEREPPLGPDVVCITGTSGTVRV